MRTPFKRRDGVSFLFSFNIPSLICILLSLFITSSVSYQSSDPGPYRKRDNSELISSLFLNPIKKGLALAGIEEEFNRSEFRNKGKKVMERPLRNYARGFLVRPMKKNDLKDVKDFMTRPTKRIFEMELEKKQAKDFLMGPIRSDSARDFLMRALKKEGKEEEMRKDISVFILRPMKKGGRSEG
uniref:Uncharacterized protein n=1 Tax=Lepeophtheirus salmonis TaxID=72036 RepID=A0A0K2T879_LEPSM